MPSLITVRNSLAIGQWINQSDFTEVRGSKIKCGPRSTKPMGPRKNEDETLPSFETGLNHGYVGDQVGSAHGAPAVSLFGLRIQLLCGCMPREHLAAHSTVPTRYSVCKP